MRAPAPQLRAPSFRLFSGERVGAHKSKRVQSEIQTHRALPGPLGPARSLLRGLAFEIRDRYRPILIPALFTLLAVTACHSHDFPQYPPNYREYAYVTNSGSNTNEISVIGHDR